MIDYLDTGWLKQLLTKHRSFTTYLTPTKALDFTQQSCTTFVRAVATSIRKAALFGITVAVNPFQGTTLSWRGQTLLPLVRAISLRLGEDG